MWRVANEKRSSRTLIRPWINFFLLPFPFTAVSLFIVNRATSFQAQRGIVGRNEARLDLKRPYSESESEKKKKAKALVGNDGCCHSVTILISWPPLVASAVVVVATVVGLFLKKKKKSQQPIWRFSFFNRLKIRSLPAASFFSILSPEKYKYGQVTRWPRQVTSVTSLVFVPSSTYFIHSAHGGREGQECIHCTHIVYSQKEPPVCPPMACSINFQSDGGYTCPLLNNIVL